MDLKEKLRIVQNELKVPKSQFNDYGGYSYRSCEDIMEKAKPLLKEQGITLLITDSIEIVGDRFYLKASASVSCGNETMTVSGFAREPLSQKGMNESQITGSASSYARKYALNGLFLIDDARDFDSMKPEKGKSNQKGHRLNDEQKAKLEEAKEFYTKTGKPNSAATADKVLSGRGDYSLLDRFFARYNEVLSSKETF